LIWKSAGARGVGYGKGRAGSNSPTSSAKVPKQTRRRMVCPPRPGRHAAAPGERAPTRRRSPAMTWSHTCEHGWERRGGGARSPGTAACLPGRGGHIMRRRVCFGSSALLVSVGQGWARTCWARAQNLPELIWARVRRALPPCASCGSRADRWVAPGCTGTAALSETCASAMRRSHLRRARAQAAARPRARHPGQGAALHQRVRQGAGGHPAAAVRQLRL